MTGIRTRLTTGAPSLHPDGEKRAQLSLRPLKLQETQSNQVTINQFDPGRDDERAPTGATRMDQRTVLCSYRLRNHSQDI